jgi:hypothetical protein
MADLFAAGVTEIHREILPSDFDDLAGSEPPMAHPISDVK